MWVLQINVHTNFASEQADWVLINHRGVHALLYYENLGKILGFAVFAPERPVPVGMGFGVNVRTSDERTKAADAECGCFDLQYKGTEADEGQRSHGLIKETSVSSVAPISACRTLHTNGSRRQSVLWPTVWTKWNTLGLDFGIW